MSIRYTALFTVALSSLSACTGDLAPPVVAEFNGRSVTIQDTGMFNSAPRVEVAVEAARVCEREGMSAEYASSQQVSDFRQNHLYLCV